MKNFRNYIFDLGGVLLDINMQNALDGFRAIGVPEEELRFDEGETARIMQNYQLGLLTTEEFCDAIASRCRPRGAAATLKSGPAIPTRQQVANAWNSICLDIPQRKIDALRALKKKANVYLLSNTNDLHWICCLEHWFNVGSGAFGKNQVNECFHHIFLSQEMHLEKPNPEIFKQAIREISTMQAREFSTTQNGAQQTDATISSKTSTIDAANTVFLDDNLTNVEAAKSCGISAIHVTPDYDWVTELL